MSQVLSVDPRTGIVVEELGAETSHNELDEIAELALTAADALQGLERLERAKLLTTIAEQLDTDAEALIAIADRETALGRDRLSSELDRTVFQLRQLADAVVEGNYLEAIIEHPHHTPLGRSPDLRRLLIPVGPVAVFAAGNFPFAFSVAGGDTAAALAAGCPVIVKAHPGHPATSRRVFERVSRAIRSTGSPSGTVGLVFGFETGRMLVEHPAVRAVSFTGSAAGGRALFDAANQRPDPIPFYGELAGANPIVVTPAAARERPETIAQGIIDSVLLGSGQFCTKPGLIFIPTTEGGDRLWQRVISGLRTRTVGPLLTRAIRDNFTSTVKSLSRLPGVSADQGQPAGGQGFGVVPTSLTVDFADFAHELVTECFGPAAVFVRYDDPQRLLGLLNTLPGSLAGAVHAEPGLDDALAAQLLDALRRSVGRLIYNGYPTGVAVNIAMTHGGPWPSTTNALHSSVGATAIRRFLRPVAWQNVPQNLLPDELRDDIAPVPRDVDGHRTPPYRDDRPLDSGSEQNL